MKFVVHLPLVLARRMALVVIVLVFFSALAFGQNADPKQDLGDLSSIVWKSSPALTDALGEERVKTDITLAAPGLPDVDRSIFLSYRLLLDYIQAEIQGGKAVADAVAESYEKVLSEAPENPGLKLLPAEGLLNQIPTLIEALAETPVMAPVTAH